MHLPMKMEPIVSSETSAIRTQTPGNYPKRNNLHLDHGESLRTRFSVHVVWVQFQFNGFPDELVHVSGFSRNKFVPCIYFFFFHFCSVQYFMIVNMVQLLALFYVIKIFIYIK